VILPGSFENEVDQILHWFFHQVSVAVVVILGDQILESVGELGHIQMASLTVESVAQHGVRFHGRLLEVTLKISQGVPQVKQYRVDGGRLGHDGGSTLKAKFINRSGRGQKG